ncbi:hypothetical protein MRU69_02125 [Kocuria flava]|uniref:hypothetical protein n=1 Tax=Kocuria flava TaxID=446860 RepID=UPI001FF43123|nr:hypothetical protein [Kocuria flava]MCJ8503663.1 hypothetical protein [Kocuria flava]
MNKKKLTTALASAALAASFIVAPVAPANAAGVIIPMGPRATICYYVPFWC